MKKIKLFFWVLGIVLILLSSCAKIYYSPDAYSRARNHKTVAIIPPKVTIAPRKMIDVNLLKEQQKNEQINLQRDVYTWLLKRKSQNRMEVAMQDLETTNAKLKKAGFFIEGESLAPDELCIILGVDAVITSEYQLSELMSAGLAVTLGCLLSPILFNPVLWLLFPPTHEVHVTMSVYDKETKKNIWIYNHGYSGGIIYTYTSLAKGLSKNSSKKTPYYFKR